jgi:serine/threonine protein kinase
MSTLSENIKYKVWRDVSSGLEYIHAQNVLHLDIKPQNILLSPGRQAKIIDFGFSIRNNVEPNVFYNGGTPSYIPLEYIPNGKVGRPADVWALGITMLFVLGLIPLPNGKWKIADTPRDGTKEQKSMLDWVDQVDGIVKNIPDTLSPLRQMLNMNPRNRITASQLVSDLRSMQRVKAASGELLV